MASKVLQAATPPPEYYDITDKVFKHMWDKKLYSRREYQGSEYKGTRVGDKGDFDQMFIQRTKDIIAEPDCSGYSILKNIKTEEVVSPATAKDRFKGELQKSLTALDLEERTILREHGPAVQLDVYAATRGQGKRLFSVDFVFTYDVKQNDEWNLFAPISYTSDDNSWVNKSKVNEEKRHMKSIDKGNGVGKLAVKILKNVMAEESTLQVLSGYVFETALMYEKGSSPNTDEWTVSELEYALTRILNRVADALVVGRMDAYFDDPPRNILPTMSDVTRSDVVNRLRRLGRTPQRLIPGSPDYAYGDKEAPEGDHAQAAGTLSESASACSIQ